LWVVGEGYIEGDNATRASLGVLGVGLITSPLGQVLLDARLDLVVFSSSMIAIAGVAIVARARREGLPLGLSSIAAGVIAVLALLSLGIGDVFTLLMWAVHMLSLAAVSVTGIIALKDSSHLSKTLLAVATVVFLMASLVIFSQLLGLTSSMLLFPPSYILASLFSGTGFILSSIPAPRRPGGL
jgi:hypothetical protein